MNKKIIKTMLLLTLIVLLIGIVSATTTNNNTHTTKTTDLKNTNQKTTPHEPVTKLDTEKNDENINDTYLQETNKTIKKKRSNKIKTEHITITDFTSLNNELTNPQYDNITLNINNNITLNGNTSVSNQIKTLTINGNGYTIDGNNEYQFLHINKTTVTLNNMIITNCIGYKGGAIYTKGNLTITNSILNNNNATQIKDDASGGAIYGDDGNISITHSTFKNNVAKWYGGAIHNKNGKVTVYESILIDNISELRGGAIYISYGTSNIINSKLTNNTATIGGAIDNWYVTLNITDSTFINNTATQDGGTIHNIGGNISINHCTFKNSTAKWDGGVIHNEGRHIIIKNSVLNDNILKGDYSRGGVIYSSFGNITLYNSTLNNNSQTNGSGGAIYNCGNITLTECTLNYNNATGSGGAISNDGNLTIRNSNLNYNNANSGGAIHNREYANITLTDTNFTNNTAIGEYSAGGAIRIDTNNNINITYSNFTNNTATGESSGGGAIHAGTNNNITITYSNFTNNTAIGESSDGGAIQIDTYNNINITFSNFINNTAIYGGAIRGSLNNLNITSTNFTNNCVSGNKYSYAYGGAIYVYCSNITIIKANFNNNNANNTEKSYGGAIYVNSDSYINITDTNFTNNSAGEYGGAISGYNKNEMFISHSNFINNEATGTAKHSYAYGGAIYGYSTNITITDTEFINNTATYGYGGAIGGCIYSVVLITYSNFTNNTASDGGAIYGTITSNITLIGTNFTNNTASDGGAIIAYENITIIDTNFTNNVGYYGGAIHGSGNITIINTNFTNNTSTLMGGAISGVTTSNITIIDTNFIDNIAKYYGGAIYGITTSNITLIGTNFTNNKASAGGAIYEDCECEINIISVNFNNNTANGTYPYDGGGAIYVSNVNITITNSNFTNNIASNGGAIYVYNTSNINIRYSNFTNNKASDYGGAIYGSGHVMNNNFILNKAHSGAAIYNTQNYIQILENNFEKNVAEIQSTSSINNDGQNTTIEDNINDTISTYKNTIYNIGSYVNITSNIFQDGSEELSKFNTKLKIELSNSNPLINTPVTITAKLTDTKNVSLNNQNVFVGINDDFYLLQTDKNGIVTYEYTPSTTGIKNITAKFTGNIYYNHCNSSTSITIQKLNSKIAIKISNTSPTVNTLVTVNITLTDVNNKVLSNKDIVLTIDGKQYTQKTNTQGTITQTYTPTTTGTKTITAKYNGDNTYNPSNTTTTITTLKINTKLTIKPSNTSPIVNTPITITTTLTDVNNKVLPSKEITLTIDGKQYTQKTNTQGTITQTYTPTTTGTKTITAKYNQDNTYKSSESNMKLNVVKSTSTVTINSPSSTNFGDTFTINVTVKDQNNKAATGNVTIKTGNTTKTLTLNNGQASLSTSINTTGKYDIITTYPGNEYNLASSKTTSITVTPAPTTTTITVTSNTAGNVRVTGTVKDKNGQNVNQGNVTIKNGNNNVGSANLTNGAYNILTTISSAGNYQLTAQYMGTKNYLTSFANINTNVALKTPSITATVNGNKIGKTNITATLKDPSGTGLKGVPIIVTLPNGTQITGITNNTGVVNIAVDVRENGTLTIKYPGNNTYKAVSTSKPVSVTKNDPVIKLNPVKGVIGEDITLTAYLTDADGTPITGGNLAFKLNGKTLRSDGRFDSKAPAMKFKVENGKVTYTIKADLYLRNAKNLTASYSGNYKYVEMNSQSVEAQIQKRYAQVTTTLTPKIVKQYQTLQLTATIKDITKNHKNTTLINQDTKVMFKVNGNTLKDKNGKTLYVPVDKNKQAIYNYIIPAGTGGITASRKARDYKVDAIFMGENYYPGARNTTKFNVERSATYVGITQVKASKTNVLSVSATLKDYKQNNLIGTNKVTIKINGKSYTKNGKPVYWSVKNGNVDLTGIQVDPKTTIKRVLLVTGERQAYHEGRAETTNIIKI